jgi:hypothetical protein
MTYLDQESNSLATIQKTVIVGESEVHHLPANVSEIDPNKSDLLGERGHIPGGFRPCR